MKPIILFCLLVISSSVWCQTPTSDPGGKGPTIDSQTSRADEASNAVVERLSREVTERSGKKDDLKALGRCPLRIVFLVDTSQATTNDPYIEFVKKLCAGMLRNIGRLQSDARVKDDGRDHVWLYPYQMSLITDSDKIVQDSLLKAGAGTVSTIVAHVPSVRYSRPGETDRGHDSALSRKNLIDLLGHGGSGQNTVIIQISPSYSNSDPDHPANDKKIKLIDAHNGLLDGTGYVLYRDDGKYFQTDPPGKQQPPSDVFVWVYGPEKFSVPDADSAGTAPPVGSDPNQNAPSGKTPEPETPKDSPIGEIVVGILVLGVAGYLTYRYTLKVPITIGSELRHANTRRPLAITTAGGKSDEATLVIPQEKCNRVAPGLKVGEVQIPFLFGGPRVSGAASYSLHVNNSLKTSLPVEKKPIPVQFVKGNDKTDPINLARR